PEERSQFRKEIEQKKLNKIVMPKVTLEKNILKLKHDKGIVTVSFQDVYKNNIVIDGTKISILNIGSYNELLKKVDSLIKNKSVLSNFREFYAYFFSGIGKNVKLLRLGKIDYWLRIIFEQEHLLYESAIEKRKYSKVLNTLGYQCKGRTLESVWEEDYNYDNSLSLVKRKVSYDYKTKGYVYRFKFFNCATYLDSKGHVRFSYPNCPKKGTKIFSEAPFFNFAEIANVCCHTATCGAGPMKEAKLIQKRK
ncbi:MAG: hypothetical protein KDD61_16315, partial [Bdellovibrionales bacterium]|nr:hypothetical protein [Bdellovibrionales bacterium]